KQEIEKTENLIADVLPTLVESWNSSIEGWGYTIQNPVALPSESNYSQSTNAMILVVVAAIVDFETDKLLAPVVHSVTRRRLKKRCSDQIEQLEDNYRAGCAKA